MRELIIDKNNMIETICLLENGKLIEKYQNTPETTENRLEGNIYAGRVADIVPGMQSVFVDYGDKRKGLLHLKDLLPKIDVNEEKKEDLKQYDIRSLVKLNQKILIQIRKDSNDKKGAKVSTHITIPSRYIAFMPNTNIITISKKISEGERKEELLKLVKENISLKSGVIIRTAAFNAPNEEIIKDIKRCEKKWNSILKKYKEAKLGTIVYKSETIQEKIIIDLKLDKIITNCKEEFERIKEIIKNEKLLNLKLEMKAQDDLLELYDLRKQINKAKQRKVWLDCGGFITIERTEALTAIDVNTGKYTGKTNLENTVYKVNKEATIEIVKQLRLRDIGGIVIIDYIDMYDENNKTEIEELLKEELKRDRAKTQVEGFTKLNLMEMTRKHICSHLDDE